MNVSFIIRDLLLRYEQLVVPGFGTFRIVIRPAQISRSTHVLLPPAREIVFDGQHRIGDNQLLMAIRKKAGISETETIESLKQFVTRLEEQLRESGTAELEGLGHLSIDKKGTFTFKPVDDLVEFTGIFALPKLELETAPAPSGAITNEKPAPKPAEVVSLIPRKRRWWPAALVILLAVIGIAAYMLGMFPQLKKTENETISLADTNTGRIVFGSRPQHDSLTEAISRKLDEETSREGLRLEEKPDSLVTPKPKPVTPAVPIQQPAAANTGGPFHIITGAFSVPENAEKQHADLKARGFNPTLLPKRGKYYMVSLGSYATPSEASRALENFREKLEMDLWVKKIQ